MASEKIAVRNELAAEALNSFESDLKMYEPNRVEYSPLHSNGWIKVTASGRLYTQYLYTS